uniref:DUF3456 domain-containing protein n=1 Tax=Strongyloides stercoralis TaxID=6248 RepID=A0A0K0EPZ1_STRER
MKSFFLSILILSSITKAYVNSIEIEATNYKCDICNLIIKEAFHQQTMAQKDTYEYKIKGFHSTEEKDIGFEAIDAVKSEMYLENLMSFVCGEAYFYALFKDANATDDLYRYLPIGFVGDRYQFIKNSTIQLQNDCFEMVDDFRDELIAFFKKDHIFPVMEWCHLTKGFCQKNETMDFKAYSIRRNESDLNGMEEVFEVKIKDHDLEDINNLIDENDNSFGAGNNYEKKDEDKNKSSEKIEESIIKKEL